MCHPWLDQPPDFVAAKMVASHVGNERRDKLAAAPDAAMADKQRGDDGRQRAVCGLLCSGRERVRLGPQVAISCNGSRASEPVTTAGAWARLKKRRNSRLAVGSAEVESAAPAPRDTR